MRPENSEKKEFVLSGKNTAQRIRNGGSILFESGGEFILPDYMPKVQKVLRMEARALPACAVHQRHRGADVGQRIAYVDLFGRGRRGQRYCAAF